MEHLTDQEIYDFAHVSDYDEDSVRIVNAVNRHIMECSECAKRVSLAVRYYDAVDSLIDGVLPLSSGFGIPREQVVCAAESLTVRKKQY